MNNVEIQEIKIQREKLKPAQPHYSDRNLSVPAKTQANIGQNNKNPANTPAVLDSTAGNEGWLDTCSDKPEVYPSKQVLPQQQPYIYWIVAVIVSVAALVLLLAFRELALNFNYPTTEQ